MHEKPNQGGKSYSCSCPVLEKDKHCDRKKKINYGAKCHMTQLISAFCFSEVNRQ